MKSALEARVEQICASAFGADVCLLGASDVDPEYRSDVARTKRFIERFMGDQRFRRDFPANPVGTLASIGLEVDPEALRPFWDEACARELGPYSDRELAHSASVARYRLFMLEKLAWRERWQQEACAPTDPRLRAWRRRQIARCHGELGVGKATALVHAPFAVELSQGCSIGCWFCGLSAEKKQSDFLYDEPNARLWRGALDGLARALGDDVEGGFLYWATDPLDNPHYESFARDMARRFGTYPQTTTAQAHRHVERMRSLLEESRQRGCTVNRFSILTRKLLDRAHEAFSPEELLFTELILQYDEVKGLPIAPAGSARDHERLERMVDRRRSGEDETRTSVADTSTIACVSGVLLNMVDRRVELITPCASSERWPKGYWVIAGAHFRSGPELAEVLTGMLDDHVKVRLGIDDRVRLRRDVQWVESSDALTLASPFLRSDLSGLRHVREIAAPLSRGGATAGEIALALEAEQGIPLDETLQTLDAIFQHGLLDEEPIPRVIAEASDRAPRVAHTG